MFHPELLDDGLHVIVVAAVGDLQEYIDFGM